MLGPLLAFLGSRLVAVALHELTHGAVAIAYGLRPTVHLGLGPFSAACTTVPGAGARGCAAVSAIRHGGWLFSVALPLVATRLWLIAGSMSVAALAALWLTALDAVCSDALGWTPRGRRPPGAALHAAEAFYCGNFGLLLLDAAHSDKAREIVNKMIRVTMMRGAQSAGIVTYKPLSKGKVLVKRYRVVNAKRTDLCNRLMHKCEREFSAWRISAPQLFQGHTRFATSSISSLEGCHPHQWTPARPCLHWRHVASADRWVAEEASVVNFITHNGDLDFYELHGVSYPLSDLQKLLPGLLHSPCAAEVDSFVIAGLVDLLRTSGVWRLSVRYGYVYGGLVKAGNLMGQRDRLWGAAELTQLSAAFESTWTELLEERDALAAAAPPSRPPLDRAMSLLGHTLEHWRGSGRASGGDKDANDRRAAMSEDGRSLLDAMVSSMLEGPGARRLAGIKHGLVRAVEIRVCSLAASSLAGRWASAFPTPQCRALLFTPSSTLSHCRRNRPPPPPTPVRSASLSAPPWRPSSSKTWSTPRSSCWPAPSAPSASCSPPRSTPSASSSSRRAARPCRSPSTRSWVL